MNSKTKAVFLDRDGVINKDSGYVYEIEKFIFIDGVFEALRYFQGLGYLLIVVTNQSGIGRGYYSEDDFQKLTAFMIDEFKKEGIEIAKVYHCKHSPEEKCECRKPAPKMLLDAQKEYDIDMKSSIMIGDKKSDIVVGKNAGVGKTIFIGDECEKEADFCVKNLLEVKTKEIITSL